MKLAALRHGVGAAESEAGSGQPAVGQPARAPARSGSPRRATATTGSSQMSTRVWTWPNKPERHAGGGREEDEPEQQPAGLFSGDPHHDDEQGEEQQRRAEVSRPTITMMATTQARRIGSRNRVRAGGTARSSSPSWRSAHGSRRGSRRRRWPAPAWRTRRPVDRPEADPDAGAAERRSRRRGRPAGSAGRGRRGRSSAAGRGQVRAGRGPASARSR